MSVKRKSALGIVMVFSKKPISLSLTFLAFALYPMARAVDPNLVYITFGLLAVLLPLSIRFSPLVLNAFWAFLLCALVSEILSILVLYVYAAPVEVIKYSFISAFVWLVCLVPLFGAYRGNSDSVTWPLFFVASIYVLIIFAFPQKNYTSEEVIQYSADADRERSIFVHANEMGIFIGGMVATGAYCFASIKTGLFKALFVVPMLLLMFVMLQAGSTTSFILLAIALVAILFPMLIAKLNALIAAFIIGLFYLQIWNPEFALAIAGYRGSTWWRFLVAEEISKQVPHFTFPARYDLLTFSDTWLHSKFLDIYVISGDVLVHAFVGLIVSVLVIQRKLLSSTILGLIVLAAAAQPLGAMPAPFLLWAFLFTLALSDGRLKNSNLKYYFVLKEKISPNNYAK